MVNRYLEVCIMDKFYGTGSISREDEHSFPSFNSHTEAIKWLVNRYGDRFVSFGYEEIEGKKCYFYKLIIDKEAFEQGNKQLEEDGFIIGSLTFAKSNQDLQISEDGFVHVVH